MTLKGMVHNSSFFSIAGLCYFIKTDSIYISIDLLLKSVETLSLTLNLSIHSGICVCIYTYILCVIWKLKLVIILENRICFNFNQVNKERGIIWQIFVVTKTYYQRIHCYLIHSAIVERCEHVWFCFWYRAFMTEEKVGRDRISLSIILVP